MGIKQVCLVLQLRQEIKTYIGLRLDMKKSSKIANHRISVSLESSPAR